MMQGMQQMDLSHLTPEEQQAYYQQLHDQQQHYQQMYDQQQQFMGEDGMPIS
jgi:hypothetical protein